jgi:hypothetical protein
MLLPEINNLILYFTIEKLVTLFGKHEIKFRQGEVPFASQNQIGNDIFNQSFHPIIFQSSSPPLFLARVRG